MANLQRKKKPSNVGTGKWETNRSLERYREKRNKANRAASRSRAINRQRHA